MSDWSGYDQNYVGTITYSYYSQTETMVSTEFDKDLKPKGLRTKPTWTGGTGAARRSHAALSTA